MTTEFPDVSFEQAREYLREHRRQHRIKEHSPCHYVPMSVIDRIAGVPGVDGVKIYNGIKDGNEILVIVAAAEIDGELVDILEYTYSINKDMKNGIVDAPIQTIYQPSGPCPPPSNRCKPSRLNSD